MALTLVGCRKADSRVESLSQGISRDSAVTIMGAVAESPVQYLVKGQYIEAMFYRRPGAEGDFAALERSKLTPVVLVDGLVTGWGWDHWDSVATTNGIQGSPKK
ncbi:MAG: hypothetical protein E4H38_07270 [Gemmatimonadales bacterium]|nr:MAG: hypothetical protein E4H38_07270 [Gemmatimonadales bacterium]